MKSGNETNVVEQPLMSTGTTEPGFDKGRDESNLVTPPKIGQIVVGEQGNSKSK
jgi:hypothetical protein